MKLQLKTKIYYIPNLDIEGKLKEKGFKNLFIKRHTCKYYYFMHLILNKYEKKGRNKDFGFVRLHPRYLQTLIGNAPFDGESKNLIYRLIEHLIEWKFIEKKQWYSAENKRVTVFKIPNILYNRGILPYPNDKIEKKFLKRLMNKPKKKISPKYVPIRKLYRAVLLDKKSALEDLDRKVEEEFETRAKRIRYEGIVKPILTNERATFWQKMIDGFDNFYFDADEERGRVYSNVVNFPSSLRKHVYFKGHYGEKVWELDIRNSQPLLLSIVAMDWYKEQELTFGQDLIDYKTKCENGTFYDDFQEELESSGITVQETFKTDVFAQIMFNKESEKKAYKMKKKFNELYPSVGYCVTELKKQETGKDAYKEVSKRLTQIESKIMIDGVSKKLIKAGVTFFPLHDAIYTLKKYKELTHKMMIDEFRQFGVIPSIRVK